MTEKTENTLTAYLGPEFQQRLMWQLLVEPEFAEKKLPELEIEYFDNPNLKRLFVIMVEYYNEYDKVPNLQNQSIHQAINRFKTPNNSIEEESLFGVIKQIELWNERIINKQMLYDGDVVQKATNVFIKQQEYRKLAETVMEKVKNGGIKDKYAIAAIEEKFQKISHIGEENDDSESVTEGVLKALRKEFRETIPTGIKTMDELTGGGLGKGEIAVVLTPSGVGKALPISAPILSPNGWIRNGDIKVNDYIIGSNGKSQRVLGVYPQGEREIYKVEFNDGTSAMCDREHLWAVNSLNQRTANTTYSFNGKINHIKIPDYTYKTLTLDEIMKNYIIYNKNSKKLNYRIPIVSPIEFTLKKLEFHPYIMGVMLGDGYMRGCEFTSGDIEIIENVKNYFDGNITINKDKRKLNDLYRVRLCKSKQNLINCKLFDKLSNTKFIPNNYKYNTLNDRILLLQGLLDTDGYASKSGRIQYNTASKQLAYDVREIVLSLGGYCKICEKLPKYKYNDVINVGKRSYILTISFSNEAIKPFSLSRKQSRVIYRNKYRNNKYISNIKYSHKENAQCVYVENDDHLYVINDYILTHNTTLLTKVANNAYEQEKNVAQIIFEDTKDQIKRKHYTIWAKSALSKIDDDEENERVKEIVFKKIDSLEGKGRLIIKRFSQEDTTMKDVRNWMISYEKKWGFKFDILVLDYLDCLESHKKSPDRNEAELTIIKGFEALASDFDIPAWTAIQSNRSGFGSEFVEAHQSGGSIKRVQKAHLFMSVAKTQAQQEANFANVRIIKARFAKDGQAFEDCTFNNDTLDIIIDDPRYRHTKNYNNLKHYDDTSSLEKKMEKVNEKTVEMHANISQQLDKEKELIDKIKNEGVDLNARLRDNAAPEDNSDIKPQINFNTDLKTKSDLDKENDAVNDAVNDVVNEPKVIQENEKPKDEEKTMEEILSTDLDEVEKNENITNNMLVKKRDYQHVVPKK